MTDELEQARREIDLCQIDTTRGSITQDGAGFIVHFAAPLVDIGNHFESEVPSSIRCRTAHDAELQLLRWLRRIQQAERKQVRSGRWFGGLTEMVKRPLDPGEVQSYRAEVDHRRQVEKLRTELAQALAAKQDRREQAAAAAELKQRYGSPNLPPITGTANQTTAACAPAPRQRRGSASQADIKE